MCYVLVDKHNVKKDLKIFCTFALSTVILHVLSKTRITTGTLFVHHLTMVLPKCKRKETLLFIILDQQKTIKWITAGDHLIFYTIDNVNWKSTLMQNLLVMDERRRTYLHSNITSNLFNIS